MEIEVLLSVLNLNKNKLDKMNINTKCTIINQCDKKKYEEINNFRIYSVTDRGTAKSRNMALKFATKDILLFCDDDVVYNKNYSNVIIDAFKDNPKADAILFNLYSPNRKVKYNKKNKKIHLYNCLRYGTCNLAIKKDKINQMEFNELFGGNSKYGSGEDTLFIVNCIKKKLKIYSSKEYIGTIYHEKSTWFNGYNQKYFYDKGALFCAVSYKFSHLLCLQYLIRHKEVLKEIKLINAYKLMIQGCNDYIEENYV